MPRCGGCTGACQCSVVGSDSIQVAGNGQAGTPFTPSIQVSGDPGNTLDVRDDGVFVGEQSVAPVNTAAGVSGDGTFGNPVRLALPGVILPFAGVTIPAGWRAFFCIGGNVSRTTYSALFNAIGTTWGVGNGSTTFGLPDLQQRFLIARSGVNPVGDLGGEQQHTLTPAELPVEAAITNFVGQVGSGSSFAAVNAQGGGLPHNNLPPYAAVNFLIFY